MAMKKKVKRKSSTYQAPSEVSQAAKRSASRTVKARPANQMESERSSLDMTEGEVTRAAIDPATAIRQPNMGGNISTTEDGLTLVSMGDANMEQSKPKAKKKVSRRKALEQKTDEAALMLLEQERLRARQRERSMIEGL